MRIGGSADAGFSEPFSLLHTPILSVRFRDLNDVCGILARDLDFDS